MVLQEQEEGMVAAPETTGAVVESMVVDSLSSSFLLISIGVVFEVHMLDTRIMKVSMQSPKSVIVLTPLNVRHALTVGSKMSLLV